MDEIRTTHNGKDNGKEITGHRIISISGRGKLSQKIYYKSASDCDSKLYPQHGSDDEMLVLAKIILRQLAEQERE